MPFIPIENLLVIHLDVFLLPGSLVFSSQIEAHQFPFMVASAFQIVGQLPQSGLMRLVPRQIFSIVLYSI